MADASVLDWFRGGQAQADEISSLNNDNSQNIDILGTESVNPDIKNADTSTEPIIGSDGSFIYTDDLSGADLNSPKLEKSPLSDQIGVYTVEKGDTLSEIAELFDVSTNTIRWENNISGQNISVGQKLNILPVTGVKHIVKSGETISKIADKYEADATDILIFNDISKEDTLKQGDIIFVPNGIIKTTVVSNQKPSSKTGNTVTSNTKVPSGYYMRPVPGVITSPYGSRRGGFHYGIDMRGTRGTPVIAAASGIVVEVVNGCVEGRRSCGGRYGNYILIEHPNGTSTRYAHLSKVSVFVGKQVSQGEQIGKVGNTGRSSGPHLHFQIENSNGSTMRPQF